MLTLAGCPTDGVGLTAEQKKVRIARVGLEREKLVYHQHCAWSRCRRCFPGLAGPLEGREVRGWPFCEATYPSLAQAQSSKITEPAVAIKRRSALADRETQGVARNTDRKFTAQGDSPILGNGIDQDPPPSLFNSVKKLAVRP